MISVYITKASNKAGLELETLMDYYLRVQCNCDIAVLITSYLVKNSDIGFASHSSLYNSFMFMCGQVNCRVHTFQTTLNFTFTFNLNREKRWTEKKEMGYFD